jgi:hypothetical protein
MLRYRKAGLMPALFSAGKINVEALLKNDAASDGCGV